MSRGNYLVRAKTEGAAVAAVAVLQALGYDITHVGRKLYAHYPPCESNTRDRAYGAFRCWEYLTSHSRKEGSTAEQNDPESPNFS